MALAILALLVEAPMHTYRMQRLIMERGKDAVINASQRAGLYQTVGRLLRQALIEIRETTQAENRPERTVYSITPAGRAMLFDWMRQILSTPAAEFPAFPAALAYLALLAPDDAKKQLKRRTAKIKLELRRMADELNAAAQIPRLFLIETEYLREMKQAELAFVRGLIADLESGALTWNEQWLREVAARFESHLDNV